MNTSPADAMQDLLPQNKPLFWGAVILTLLLAMIPSFALIETAQEYFSFLLHWNPSAIPATRMGSLPHRGPAVIPDNQRSQVHFVQFTLAAPQAKEVLLAGDFNNWKPEPMSHSQESKGRWELLLPLPPGKYLYLFQVDGTWTVDPTSKEAGQKGELKTSIRQVP